MKKRIPKFRSPEEAALFWENHEVLDYIKPEEFKVVYPWKDKKYRFVNPKKRIHKQLISLRVDSSILDKAKRLASRRNVGYLSILRQWIEKAAHRI